MYIPDLCQVFLLELYSSPLTLNVISWCLSRGKHTRTGCTRMSTSCHISVASGWIMCLSAHIFIYFFPPSRGVSGRQMSCSQEKNNLRWKKGGGSREGGGGKKIYEYANPVTVWNLVMSGKCCRHLSLCRGHCLMPGSWAQLLLLAIPPNLSCHLTAT